MNDPEVCGQCGARLAQKGLRGLCPRCLMEAGLGPTPEPAATVPCTVGVGPGSPPAPPLGPGREFGPYRIVSLLGRGGMGSVYEAEHRDTGRRVALKVLAEPLRNEDARGRFLREGRLMASISHPNSVYIFAAEEIDGIPVIAMELLEGGTLHRQVRTAGPMAPAQAVDAILHVIGGLEAAGAHGVLHRDIKPSNCFLDHNGTVKVGDYGLSIVPRSAAESQITSQGSFLGTPGYCSPEQLRGEPLDVRSDVYGVGATLYFLLTGKEPFEGGDMVNVVAAALDRMPTPPHVLQPRVPKALSNLAMRCMAKDPGARPGSYHELRQALAHHDSREETPASPGRRSLAFLFDGLVLTISVAYLLAALDSRYPFFSRPGLRPWFEVALFGAYYSIYEGFFGRSFGKSLLGIRVFVAGRLVPGFFRAALRAVVFWLVPFLAFKLAELALGRPALPTSSPLRVWIPMAYIACLFLTMRRRNGWAAIHDILSGTRVVELRPALESRASPASAVPLELAGNGHERIGPYRVVRQLARSADAVVTLGYDERLRRNVWIRRVLTPGTALMASARRVSRAGRLHWLNGQQDWDAFEAPAGVSLLACVNKPKPWSQVRFWLADLAGEIMAAQRDGSLPGAIGLDRVWITDSGRAILSDFPCPGSDGPLPGNAAPAAVADIRSVQSFLNQVAIVAMDGRIVGWDEAAGRPVQRPVALDARQFLGVVARGGFARIEMLLGNLQPLLQHPQEISRSWRAVSVVYWPILACWLLFRVAYVSNASEFWLAVKGLLALALTPAAIAAWVNVGGTLFFGRGIGLFLLGMAPVDCRGAPASGPRRLCRALAVFLALGVGLFLVRGAGSAVPRLTATDVLTTAAVFLAVLANLCWTVWNPQRNLADLLAGTWLVPAHRSPPRLSPSVRRYALGGILTGLALTLAPIRPLTVREVTQATAHSLSTTPVYGFAFQRASAMAMVLLFLWGLVLLAGSGVAYVRARNAYASVPPPNEPD